MKLSELTDELNRLSSEANSPTVQLILKRLANDLQHNRLKVLGSRIVAELPTYESSTTEHDSSLLLRKLVVKMLAQVKFSGTWLPKDMSNRIWRDTSRAIAELLDRPPLAFTSGELLSSIPVPCLSKMKGE